MKGERTQDRPCAIDPALSNGAGLLPHGGCRHRWPLGAARSMPRRRMAMQRMRPSSYLP
jgi:hypothetical protein